MLDYKRKPVTTCFTCVRCVIDRRRCDLPALGYFPAAVVATLYVAALEVLTSSGLQNGLAETVSQPGSYQLSLG